MSLTLLDPKTALIIVDLQKGLVGGAALSDFHGVVEQSAVLARTFRAQGLPVVLVTVDGTAPGRTEQPSRRIDAVPAEFKELVAELEQQPGDILVTKRTWGAFATTDLEARLKALDVTQVVIAGVATGSGVEATARQAYEAGFNVTLALDAMADPRAGAHDHCALHVFPRLGETGTVDDIIKLLTARA